MFTVGLTDRIHGSLGTEVTQGESMAKAKVQKSETVVTLELNGEEAGYLLDLLSAHVGGPLTLEREPLGSIRVALAEAGVERRYAFNTAYQGHYAVLYHANPNSVRIYPETDDPDETFFPAN
jgi:hypothetical protein